jgi:hypothetical protein
MHRKSYRKIWKEENTYEIKSKTGDNIKKDLEETDRELNSSGSGQGPVAGSCEYCLKPSDSVKGWEFLGHLSHYLASQEYFHAVSFSIFYSY